MTSPAEDAYAEQKARSETVGVDVLESLSRHNSPTVRASVRCGAALNPNTPLPVLFALSEDIEPEIRART